MVALLVPGIVSEWNVGCSDVVLYVTGSAATGTCYKKSDDSQLKQEIMQVYMTLYYLKVLSFPSVNVNPVISVNETF